MFTFKPVPFNYISKKTLGRLSLHCILLPRDHEMSRKFKITEFFFAYTYTHLRINEDAPSRPSQIWSVYLGGPLLEFEDTWKAVPLRSSWSKMSQSKFQFYQLMQLLRQIFSCRHSGRRCLPKHISQMRLYGKHPVAASASTSTKDKMFIVCQIYRSDTGRAAWRSKMQMYIFIIIEFIMLAQVKWSWNSANRYSRLDRGLDWNKSIRVVRIRPI